MQNVSSGLARLTAAARQVGLVLNPAKCCLTTGSDDCPVNPSLFPAGLPVNRSGAFALLGAAIGNRTYCEAHTYSKRVEASRPLMEALGELEDPQTSLLLLRECASYCKVVYSSRVTPPSLHSAALAAYDEQVRASLEASCTGPLTPDAWEQATLPTGMGGLGLRRASGHSVAAYLASLVATADLCCALDNAYSPAFDNERAAYNNEVPEADRIPVPAPTTLRQQQLSQALDGVTLRHLGAAGLGREAFRAHLQLLQQPRAGAWLHAPPAEALGLHVAPALFRIMVRLRLRMPVMPSDTACPLCDAACDRFGDHARVCPCGGDRTKRHNRLRSVLAARAHTAGLSPEVEKPGLLPARPDDGGAPEDGSSAARAASGRRPRGCVGPALGLTWSGSLRPRGHFWPQAGRSGSYCGLRGERRR